MTAFKLAEICAKILPPGVLNIVHGYGHKVGAALRPLKISVDEPRKIRGAL